MFRSVIFIFIASITACGSILGQVGSVERIGSVIALCSTIIVGVVAVLRCGYKILAAFERHHREHEVFHWLRCWPRRPGGIPMTTQEVYEMGSAEAFRNHNIASCGRSGCDFLNERGPSDGRSGQGHENNDRSGGDR